MTKSESPLLAGRRWGVGLGTALILMLLAGAGGAVTWGFYRNDVLTRLGFDLERATAPLASAPTSVPDLSAMFGLMKDLQASHQRMAEQLEAALQLLTAEQTSSIATAAALAALGAKLDTFQRPAVPVVKKPPPGAPRKPVTPKPPIASPETQLEPPPGAPTPLRE